MDFRFNYSHNVSDFDLQSNLNQLVALDNISEQQIFNFKGDYSQPLKLLSEGKIGFGGLFERLSFDTESFGVNNLDYARETTSSYLELQSKWKKFEFIAGGRGEFYNIYGATATANLIPFKQFQFFPNASVQYNFTPQVYFNANYNRKSNLPSTTALNPNNTTYQNQNVNITGNPNLQPTIFENYEVEINAFDHFSIGFNRSIAKNFVAQRITNTGNVTNNTNINVEELKIHSFNFSLPIPYMLFTKGLSGMIKAMTAGGVNPDKLNFLYVYAGRQFYELPSIETKGFWTFNLMSQVLLPKDIKWMTMYRYTTTNGNYNYFRMEKPFNESLDVSFTKKFLDDHLTVAVNFDDILNTNRAVLQSVNTPLYLYTKNDTRRFGFTLHYKIPTKNKLAKEDPNLLNKEKKEENGTVIGN